VFLARKPCAAHAFEFGGFERAKEECREARGATFMETLLQDLRYGVRTMLRAPGFTAIAVVALALGIGANAAIFSVVNAVLLRPLAYKDSARLVTILMNGSGPVAVANYLDWRDLSHSFKAMGAADYWSPNLTGIDSPEHIRGLKVTQSLFPMLGVEPLLGRLFVESCASGTVAVNGSRVRNRKPSPLKNQNVLFRPPKREMFNGPPALPPNWFCTHGGLARPTAFKKKSFALKILLRRYSYTSPCSELVPAFVLRLVTPPENLPHSGPRLLV
jgi:hypothetical protein